MDKELNNRPTEPAPSWAERLGRNAAYLIAAMFLLALVAATAMLLGWSLLWLWNALFG